MKWLCGIVALALLAAACGNDDGGGLHHLTSGEAHARHTAAGGAPGAVHQNALHPGTAANPAAGGFEAAPDRVGKCTAAPVGRPICTRCRIA